MQYAIAKNSNSVLASLPSGQTMFLTPTTSSSTSISKNSLCFFVLYVALIVVPLFLRVLRFCPIAISIWLLLYTRFQVLKIQKCPSQSENCFADIPIPGCESAIALTTGRVRRRAKIFSRTSLTNGSVRSRAKNCFADIPTLASLPYCSRAELVPWGEEPGAGQR